MALPGKLGASLAADMGKNGLMSAAPAAPAEDDDAPEAALDGDSIEAILSDIDDKVPGLGALIHELVDRIRAEDEEQDAEGS